MRPSKLNHQLELLKLEQTYQLEILKAKQKQEVNELLSTCTHKYDDGTSAQVFEGMQWDYYFKCEICNKVI